MRKAAGGLVRMCKPLPMSCMCPLPPRSISAPWGDVGPWVPGQKTPLPSLEMGRGRLRTRHRQTLGCPKSPLGPLGGGTGDHRGVPLPSRPHSWRLRTLFLLVWLKRNNYPTVMVGETPMPQRGHPHPQPGGSLGDLLPMPLVGDRDSRVWQHRGLGASSWWPHPIVATPWFPDPPQWGQRRGQPPCVPPLLGPPHAVSLHRAVAWRRCFPWKS